MPPKSTRFRPRDYDAELYKSRHFIENFFLKYFCAIAARYNKTATYFLAAIHLVASYILFAKDAL